MNITNACRPRPRTRGRYGYDTTKRAPGRGGQAPFTGLCAGRSIQRCADSHRGGWEEMWLSRTHKQLATGFVP